MSQDPILIAGAGPTGLVLAIWLKKINPQFPLKLISNATGPGTTSRAIVVHARTLEFYRQLGVADKIIEKGTIVDRITIWKHGTRQGLLPFGDIGTGQSKYPFILSIGQDIHEQVLLDYLDTLGVSVGWEQELQSIEQFSDHVTATINGVMERFSYIAGCDGAHSTVRKCLDIQMQGGTYPQHFFVADVRVPEDRAVQGINLSPDEKMMAVFIQLAEPGHCRIIGAYILPGDAKEASFEHVRADIKAATTLDVTEVEWFSVYRVRHSVVEKFSDRRVFLVGDAAHQHSPVGGQGMNTGIGDASNLAWKLASVHSGAAPKTLLDTYHPERYAFAQSLVNHTDHIFTYMTDPGWLGWLCRSFFIPYVMPLLWKIPAVRPKYYQIVSQIAVEYSNSALNTQTHPSSAQQLYAGRRLPWLKFDEIDTHEPLPKPQWHIVRFASGNGDGDIVTTSNGVTVRNFEFTEEAVAKGFLADKVYLVRPDGYIGAIVDGFDDELDDYAKKWGITTS